MRRFNVIILAASCSAIGEAKQIHETCLHLSDDTAGQERGEYISNVSQLVDPAVDDQMRIHSVTTCTDSENSVIGLKLFLSVDPYSDTSAIN